MSPSNVVAAALDCPFTLAPIGLSLGVSNPQSSKIKKIDWQ
jgi:hypothetical protein